jgi:hypothetical protein
MQAQSDRANAKENKVKRCSDYVAADYEKKLAILTRKLEDAKMQGTNETKMSVITNI